MTKRQPRLTKRERKALDPASATRTARGTAGTYRTSANVSTDAMGLADDYFAEKDRRGGPAQQMMDFVEPLMEKAQAEGDIDAMNKVMSFGMIFWNLAILPETDRIKALKDAEETICKNDGDREAFHRMASVMIARHEAMFPWLHASRR